MYDITLKKWMISSFWPTRSNMCSRKRSHRAHAGALLVSPCIVSEKLQVGSQSCRASQRGHRSKAVLLGMRSEPQSISPTRNSVSAAYSQLSSSYRNQKVSHSTTCMSLPRAIVYSPA